MDTSYIYNVNIEATLGGDCPDTLRGRWLVYSPLTHSMVVADEDNLYEAKIRLMAPHSSPQLNYVTSPRNVFALTILPNNICNFACSYCYAAKGHGSDEIDTDTLRTVLDYFVDPFRTSRHDLYISFGGGGEPLLSWEKMLFAIEYSNALAKKGGINIHYSYASNGSVINDEIVSTIKKYNIKSNVSFDILEDVQNLQRRNYDTVCRTLYILLDNDISPTINSVITLANVERQCEMVEHIHRRFPKLVRLSFDYVVDGQLFDSTEALRRFYNRYTDNFYRARRLGGNYGISVSSIKHHNLSLLKNRACAGGFDLTAQGKLSMCFFVSSPKEPLYNEFIYGSVENGQVIFDEQKFKELVEFSTNDSHRCRQCFIRWHCGGGCLYQTKSYSPQMLEEMCSFQRRFSLLALLEKINKC